MASINIRAHVDSDTLHLPELKPFIGQDVEITIKTAPVTEQEWQKIRESLKGTILRDDDPFGPAVPPEDWEAVA
jgi:hypothetical protein